MNKLFCLIEKSNPYTEDLHAATICLHFQINSPDNYRDSNYSIPK